VNKAHVWSNNKLNSQTIIEIPEQPKLWEFLWQ